MATKSLNVKRLGAIVAAVVALAIASAVVRGLTGGTKPSTASGSAPDAASPATIYDMPFTTMDGGTSDLAAYSGEPLVVNFFASWCVPCRRELPDFEAVHLANPEVTFLGINHDIDETSWRSFVNETTITFDTVFQPDLAIYNRLEGIGMPTTAFIATDGTVVDVHSGALSAEQLQETIDALVEIG